MHRLLYISESRIREADAEAVVAQIVTNSQVSNALSGLTGALIFTGQHFAQVLEGPQDTIHTLMAYIHADPRHTNIVVVDKSPLSCRLFADWQMAYQGPSQFVSRHVTTLLHATTQSERKRAAEWLTELAREFTSVPSHAEHHLSKTVQILSEHRNQSLHRR